MKYKGKIYHRVCYVATIYALLLYLCRYSLQEISDTMFIFGYGIPKDIAGRFANSIFLDEYTIDNRFIQYSLKHRWLQWIVIIYYWYFRVPRIQDDDILFAQDHLTLSGFICSRPYILVEDGVGYITNNTHNGNVAEYRRIRHLSSYPLRRLFFGHASMMCFGDNPNCIRLLLTRADSSEHIKGKEQEVMDLRQCWQTASRDKRQYILGIYDMTEKDIETISSKPVVFFTQPLYLSGVPKQEQMLLTRRILDKYEHRDIVIKTHPRDELDYRSEFPDILVFDKRIPSQLFDATGVRFTRAVTICSTAACSLDYDVQVDWYGTTLCENGLMIYGHIDTPEGANSCSI